jgi:DNA-3-methyladenine glycosylase I
MTNYCDYCNSHPEDAFNKVYHDTQYGFPIDDDNLLFERLILEINQAGLSWITILKKADHFRAAYSQYDESDRARLMNDPGIIRNRLKVNAAIVNAQRIQDLRTEPESFKGWLDSQHPQTLENWIKIFKRTFTGGEMVKEFLMSAGYLPGAHTPDCPIYDVVVSRHPAWYIPS